MQPIKIAIQKSGRLTEDSLNLLKSCDISFEKSHGNTKLKTVAWNFPLEILFVRDEDIPTFVADGIADLGIVGENIIQESALMMTTVANASTQSVAQNSSQNSSQNTLNIIEKLDFSHCRLALAVPKGCEIKTIQDLEGKRIATTYPNILAGFLKQNNITAEIHIVNGSVEIAPSIGVAEAICDLVGTGSTLLLNGLRELETVLKSEAVLISKCENSVKQNQLIHDLVFRIQAVLRAKNSRYMLLNAPAESLDKVLAVLPSLKSPTILPLADNKWYSVHCVINTKQFWEIVQKLKAAGAEGILVSSLEKIIP